MTVRVVSVGYCTCSSFVDQQRDNVFNRLIEVVGTKGRTRLSLTLEVKGNGGLLVACLADLHLHSTHPLDSFT